MIIKVIDLFEFNEINENLKLDHLIKKEHDILKLEDVNIKGFINKNLNEVIINLDVSVNSYLPCGRTFKEVLVPLSFNIETILGNDNDADFILENEIDLGQLVYSYILIEKPYVVYHESSKAFEEDEKSTINLAFASLIEE